jgi:hypothetical protein
MLIGQSVKPLRSFFRTDRQQVTENGWRKNSHSEQAGHSSTTRVWCIVITLLPSSNFSSNVEERSKSSKPRPRPQSKRIYGRLATIKSNFILWSPSRATIPNVFTKKKKKNYMSAAPGFLYQREIRDIRCNIADDERSLQVSEKT